MKKFGGKRIFIYGDGLSGRAARAAIVSGGGRARIYSDKCGRFTAPADGKYDGCVISPGIPFDHPVYRYARERGIKALSEVDIGFTLAGDRVIGVTGTNGKTTTVELIAAMTGGIACGNIGYPISEAALAGGGTLVCELSSFQLYLAQIAPKVAVITNIAADHIDRHGSAEEYWRCKCNIARNMTGGRLVIGPDIAPGALATLDTGAELVRCTADGRGEACVRDGYFMYYRSRVCPADSLRLPGEHNLKNAICAVAAAKSAGADDDSVYRALVKACLPSHRLEEVGRYGGKLWVDDSKGTNIAACLAAVKSTPGSLCLIVGGRSKGEDLRTLFAGLDPRVTEVVAMGESAQELRDGALLAGYGGTLTVVDGMKDAVKVAAAGKSDTVLLSPACASFDLYTDYAARGRDFAARVRAIGTTK